MRTTMRLYFKHILALFLLCSACTFTYGNVTIGDVNKDSLKIQKEIKKGVKRGDTYFKRGPLFYEKALEEYNKVNEVHSESELVAYKLGAYYARIKGSSNLAMGYLRKAQEKGCKISKLYYYLGLVNQQRVNLDSAISNYTIYKNALATDSVLTALELEQENALVDKKITECKTATEFIKKPSRVIIDSIGDNINSEYEDYAVFVDGEENTLIYTSRKPTPKGKLSTFDATHYEDIYVSKKENEEWSKSSSLANRLNKKTNDAIIGLSLDGQRMFIYRDGNGGDIFLSELKKTSWSAPKIVKGINTSYHESSACFSSDQNTIYFISDRPGGFGGKDIYKTTRVGKNKWSEPENLGDGINTPYNETTVVIHPIGDELYFSSKGHNSMGGYDVFKSKIDNEGNFSPVENLGYPINTVGDDISFIPTLDDKIGYYASQGDDLGDFDIYLIYFLGPEIPGFLSTSDNLLSSQSSALKNKIVEPKITVRENGITILKGVISDAVTNDLLEATIEILDNKEGKVISSFKSNGETGKYFITLKSGRDYGISVKAEDYVFYSGNVVIPASTENQEIVEDIELNQFKVGSKIVLKNIFFDTDKSTLKEESILELERLKALLTEYKNLQIEISGHTDNRGSASYNQKLSEARAKAVVDYLIEHGIAFDRLVHAGFGFDQPIATNETDEGRDQNRRTEFKIISTDFKSSSK